MVMVQFVLRHPKEGDEEALGKLDRVFRRLFLYHGDFERENMLLAVGSGMDGASQEILGAGCFLPHETFHCLHHLPERDPGFLYHLDFSLCSRFPRGEEDSAVKQALLQGLIDRAGQIQFQYPGKRIVLSQYHDADDLEGLSFLLKRGFGVYDTIVKFRYDLSKEIPAFPLPEGVELRPYRPDTAELLEAFHQLETAAFDGAAWSINHLRWMMGGEDALCFGAFCGEKLIANVCTWSASGEEGVTENIFASPDWQGRGLTQCVISQALGYLKGRGKRWATLGTHGPNRRAIRLYSRLGYEPDGFRLVIGYELNGRKPHRAG